MGMYRQKKQVVKEAFKIIEIPVYTDDSYTVKLENDESITVYTSNEVKVGDFVVTQTLADRYHCPREVFFNGYEKVTGEE